MTYSNKVNFSNANIIYFATIEETLVKNLKSHSFSKNTFQINHKTCNKQTLDFTLNIIS